jgi:hypothetical protein
MVQVRTWQWQYWQSCDEKNIVLKMVKKMAVAVGRADIGSGSGITGGSGLLQLAPLERGDQGGSNGTS